MKNKALAITDATSRSLGFATAQLNDAINDHVVRLAKANGSTTIPSARYVLKRVNAKLRKQKKALEAAGADQNAQARVYAEELERTKAELAKAQGQLEASDKGLTVAPPKVQLKEDPEKDRRLKDQQERIAALEKAKAEAEHRAKYNAALLEKADAQLIDKSTRLAQLESPADYLAAFSSQVSEEYIRRLNGAIGATRRGNVEPTFGMVHTLETVNRLSGELLELWKNRRAHDGTAVLPALEARP